jgi:membrane protease YdiL (CAAX protease family)
MSRGLMKKYATATHIVYIFLSVFLSSAFFMSLVGLDKILEKRMSVMARMAINHLMLIVVIFVFLYLLPGGLRKWGMNLNNWRKSLWLGLASGLVIGVLFSFFSYGATLLRWNWVKFVAGFKAKENLIEWLSQLLLVGTSEEMFFRGFLVTWLMKKYSKKILGIHSSVIIVSVMCGLLQFYKLLFGATLGNITLLVAGSFVYSLWLGLIYQKTASLLGSVLAHNLGNSLMVLGGLGI